MINEEIQELQNTSTTRWIVQHTRQGTYPIILAVYKTEEGAKNYVSLMYEQNVEFAQGLRIFPCLIEL